MAANGISTLPTKEERQLAKLALAANKREADGNPRADYNIDQLPTKYVGNDVVDNENPGGLIIGRPWILGTHSVGAGFELITDAGDTLITDDGDILITE